MESPAGLTTCRNSAPAFSAEPGTRERACRPAHFSPSSRSASCAPRSARCTSGRQRGAMPSSIEPMGPAMRLCGSALTVLSPPGENLWLHDAVHVAQPGDVLVINSGGHSEFGYWGKIMSHAAIARQLGGARTPCVQANPSDQGGRRGSNLPARLQGDRAPNCIIDERVNAAPWHQQTATGPDRRDYSGRDELIAAATLDAERRCRLSNRHELHH